MFSVVVPIWNARSTLARTVASVLAQDFRGFELLLIDDGSTDGGLETLPRPLDARVVVLRQENGGRAAACNTGLRQARHDWIAFIDADDLWLPGHLTELDRIRRRFPDAGLIGTAYIDTDFQGRYAVPRDDPEPVIEVIRYFERVGRDLKPLGASSAAVTRAAIEEVGPYGSYRIGDESELFARIALRRPVATSTRKTAVYVHGTGGLTERGQVRWRGVVLRSAADIAPAVATVMRHCAAGVEPPPGLDEYVDRYVGWCLRASAAIGDVQTIRKLRPFYRLRPSAEDRLLLAIGQLPPRPARLIGRPGWWLFRIGRRALVSIPRRVPGPPEVRSRVPVPLLATEPLRRFAGGLPAGLNRAIGLRYEVRFWRRFLETRGYEWPEDYDVRLDPAAELVEPLIVERLASLPETVSILDVGAGPMTALGKRVPGRRIDITAVDPLGDAYRRLLEERGLRAPVPTLACAGEDIRERFGDDRFDVVYARNALDHSRDPLGIIKNMLAVARPGGLVALRHVRREGEQRGYTLLHAWNFDVDGGVPVLFDRRRRISLPDALPGAQVEAYAERHWVCMVLTKAR